ncbi:unnamed protein product [Coregonus sp. 'balchen']|nr:unnamed protein product [Coregonus sp. 'balchen']
MSSVSPRVVVRSPSVHEEGEFPPIPITGPQPPCHLSADLVADGRRLVQRFNLSERVSDIHDYVQCLLLEEGLSLEEADLTNAVIVQRPLNTDPLQTLLTIRNTHRDPEIPPIDRQTDRELLSRGGVQMEGEIEEGEEKGMEREMEGEER